MLMGSGRVSDMIRQFWSPMLEGGSLTLICAELCSIESGRDGRQKLL